MSQDKGTIQDKGKTPLPSENLSIDAITREIEGSRTYQDAARLLDQNRLQAARGLFEDAYERWGPFGLEKFNERVSLSERKNSGLDLVIKESHTGEYPLRSPMIKSIGLENSATTYALTKIFWGDPYARLNNLSDLPHTANRSIDERSQHLRAEELKEDSDKLERLFLDKKTRPQVSIELNSLFNEERVVRDPTIRNLLLNKKDAKYASNLMLELSDRLETKHGMQLNDFFVLRAKDVPCNLRAAKPVQGEKGGGCAIMVVEEKKQPGKR